jgi:hypothetical protein
LDLIWGLKSANIPPAPFKGRAVAFYRFRFPGVLKGRHFGRIDTANTAFKALKGRHYGDVATPFYQNAALSGNVIHLRSMAAIDIV